MRCYRTTWCVCWAATALLLALAGLFVGSVGAVLVTGVLSGLIGAVLAAGFLRADGGTRVPASWHDRVTVQFGLRVGFGAGLLSAWAGAVGTLLLPLLVLAALTSPPVVAVLAGRGRAGRLPAAAPDQVGCDCGCADPVTVEEMRVLLALLSNPELERAWRHSLTCLRRAPSAAEWSAQVTLRTACLAELERRDPAAVRRWLDSLPPAATGPELRRLTGDGRIGPAEPPPEA